jgi:hypothetical protein
MNLSLDKELFSKNIMKENTMNLSKDLSLDKELFCSKENTMNLSKQSGDKKLFSENISSKHKPPGNCLLIRFIFINYTFIVDYNNNYYIFIFLIKIYQFPGGLCLLLLDVTTLYFPS